MYGEKGNKKNQKTQVHKNFIRMKTDQWKKKKKKKKKKHQIIKWMKESQLKNEENSAIEELLNKNGIWKIK